MIRNAMLRLFANRHHMIAVIVVTVAGCTGLKLADAPSASYGDWAQYGGSASRTHATTDSMIVPLRLAWRYEAGAGFGPSSVCAADGIVYAATLRGEIHAIDLLSGEGRGVFDAGSPVAGAPALDNVQLFVALGKGSITAYNVSRGIPSWTTLSAPSESSPLVVGERIFITTFAGEVLCLNKRSGTIEWEFSMARKHRVAIHSSPASDSAAVIFGADDGTVIALEAANGKERWRTEAGGAVFGTPSVSNGAVFFGSLDSSMYCVDLSDGRTRWSRRLEGRLYSGQAVGSGRVFVGTTGGFFYALDERTGEILWSRDSLGAMSTAPLLTSTGVCVGTLNKEIFVFDGESGRTTWMFLAEARIKSTPVFHRGFLVLMADDRTVMAFTASGEQ